MKTQNGYFHSLTNSCTILLICLFIHPFTQDARIHEDFLTQNLGFAGWIQMGTWKSGGLTATAKNAKVLHTKGGTHFSYSLAYFFTHLLSLTRLGR